MAIDILANYSTTFLICRSDRHNWSRQAHWFVADQHYAERHIICKDCSTRRVETINTRTYERIGSARYRYPKGYLTPRSGLTLTDFRTRRVRDDFEKATKENRLEAFE